jgi:fatty acid desaturase
MHICFKIIKFYFTLRCSACFGHHCIHHQEPSTTAHAASGYRVMFCWLRPPAQGWRTQPTQHHTVTRGCRCSGGKLLMMDTVMSETCTAT